MLADGKRSKFRIAVTIVKGRKMESNLRISSKDRDEMNGLGAKKDKLGQLLAQILFGEHL